MVQVGVVVMFSITRTKYNAVSVHGSRRPCYNGAAVYFTVEKVLYHIYSKVSENKSECSD